MLRNGIPNHTSWIPSQHESLRLVRPWIIINMIICATDDWKVKREGAYIYEMLLHCCLSFEYDCHSGNPPSCLFMLKRGILSYTTILPHREHKQSVFDLVNMVGTLKFSHYCERFTKSKGHFSFELNHLHQWRTEGRPRGPWPPKNSRP